MSHQVEPHEEHELAHHPTDRQYVNTFIILFIITAVEVAFSYVPALDFLLVPSLLVLAAVKFMLVASRFMHLSFDSRLFRRLFLTGIILAIAVFTIALVTFFARGGPAPNLI